LTREEIRAWVNEDITGEFGGYAAPARCTRYRSKGGAVWAGLG
jgi:hypothetical protein